MLPTKAVSAEPPATGMWRKLRTSTGLRRFAGRALGAYMKLVWRTSRVTFVPADIHATIEPDVPIILTFWHGQQFLVPFVVPSRWRPMGLFSRHDDADINAIAVESVGVGTVRGSGSHGRDFLRKGAVSATLQIIDALKAGHLFGLTADVPKIARVASKGIITLARHSGRKIVPVAISGNHRILMRSWDRAGIYFPFGRVFVVFGEPISVTRRANEEAIEKARALLEQRLNAISARAEELAGHAAPATAHADER